MKLKTTIITISLFCLANLLHGQEFELPLSLHNGYGHSTYNYPHGEKTNLKISGVPKEWKNVKYRKLETNYFQTFYRDYKLGKVTKKYYEGAQQFWKWIPDTLTLSQDAIKNKIAYAYEEDSTGTVRMIVDANNNLDLSDDKILTPLTFSPGDDFDEDSLAKTHAIPVQYEYVRDGKKIASTVNVFFFYMKNMGILYNVPQYYTAELDGQKIEVYSDYYPTLFQPKIAVIDDSLADNEKIDQKRIVSKDEFITIKGNTYKNIGFNQNKQTLILEKIDTTTIYSSQVGYQAFPFNDIDFKTKKAVSLEKLKGKYVLLDFWATGCVPCRKAMPEIKELYDNTDRSKLEIISIVCDKPSTEKLQKLTNQYNITWLQVIANNTNKINKKYNVIGVPVLFLLNPDGVIIEKNPRLELLKEKYFKDPK